MRVIIGSDHGGFKLKEEISKYLSLKEVDFEDLGTFKEEACDYPDIALAVAKAAAKSKSIGILICGTGIGMSIAANKVKGIRAAVCFDEYTAKMAREHNDANILCIGGRTTLVENAKKIVDTFLKTGKSTEARHHKRVAKIAAIEKDNFK
jgi:ribose 5-phosphate isomerase B